MKCQKYSAGQLDQRTKSAINHRKRNISEHAQEPPVRDRRFLTNINKTIIFTTTISILSIIGTLVVQLRGQNNLEKGCSYLDPILIDVMAFLVALFLVIEGIHSIFKNKEEPLKNQITRSVRIAIGLTIFAIHILQFIHK